MVCIIFCSIIMLFIQQITSLAKMESESAKLAIWLTRIVFAYKMIFWTPSFLPGYGLRAAGDVKFSMITSTLSLWICRVVVTIFLVHQFHMGLQLYGLVWVPIGQFVPLYSQLVLNQISDQNIKSYNTKGVSTYSFKNLI